MSKEESEFKASEPDFIENVETPRYTNDKYTSHEEIDVPFVFTLDHVLTFIVLYAGYLADYFVSNLGHVMNTEIADDIGQPPDNFYWILTIPMLVGALLGPVFGRASDMFGRKDLQLAGSVSGIIGSAIAVRTNSMRVLMVASAFHGISSAGHQLALTSIVEIIPRRYRAMANGLFVAALLPAVGFSPLIGAALTLHSSWRALYWLALGLYIFGFIGTLLFYHPAGVVYQETESFGERLKQFDYIGAFLVVSGIITIAMGLIFGGTVFPWISVGVFVPTFLGGAVIVLTICWYFFNRVRYPIIPRSLAGRYWSMWACVFFIAMVSTTTNGLFPTQVQILYSQKPLAIGLFTTPYGLAGSLFAIVAGALFFPTHARWILTGYSTVMFIVSSVQVIADKDTAAGSTVLTGFIGAMHTATIVVTTTMVQLFVTHENLGLATNLIFSAYTFGGVAYGIIDQVIVHNKIKYWAIKLIVPALYKAGIPLYDLPVAVPAFLAGQITNPVFASANLVGLLEAGEALKEAYVHVFKFVYQVSILFGGILIILSVLQKSVDTPVTSHVDARLKSLRSIIPSRKSQV